MKLTNTIQIALLATSTIASPLSYDSTASRHTLLDDTIKTVIQNIITQTTPLTAAVKSFSGDVAAAAPILEASTALQSSLNKGANTILEADTLGLTEVLALLPTVLSLNSAVEDVSAALIRKKSVFDKAELSPVVLGQVEDQYKAAQSLVNVLITKLPAYLPGALGTTLASPSLNALRDAIAVFKGPERPRRGGRLL